MHRNETTFTVEELKSLLVLLPIVDGKFYVIEIVIVLYVIFLGGNF